MRTKYFRRDNKIIRATDLKEFSNTEELLIEEVEELENEITDSSIKLKHSNQLKEHYYSEMTSNLNALVELKTQINHKEIRLKEYKQLLLSVVSNLEMHYLDDDYKFKIKALIRNARQSIKEYDYEDDKEIK